MNQANERRIQEHWLQLLRGMGAQAEWVAGERCVRARLPLRRGPFPGLERSFETLCLATVGVRHVKCLEPEELFQLPMVDIGGCERCGQIEARIREAWEQQQHALQQLRAQLAALGAPAERSGGGAGLETPITSTDGELLAAAGPRSQLVLPGGGPLAGVHLARAGDRLLAWDNTWESATDLELAVTSRMTALARRAAQAADQQRFDQVRRGPTANAALAHPGLAPRPALSAEPAESADSAEGIGTGRRILLVGPKLAGQAVLQRALRERGFQVHVEKRAGAVPGAFGQHSFELVLVDTDLGRAEGLELLPTISALPGLAALPVVLVDERSRPARRQAARELGAAGYLVHPIDPDRVAAGLAAMAAGRRQRRFERFAERLAVVWPERPATSAGYTTAVSRLGLYVCTQLDLQPGNTAQCVLVVPELGRSLPVRVETVYRTPELGTEDAGLALRIRSFAEDDEPSWIRYLRGLTEQL